MIELTIHLTKMTKEIQHTNSQEIQVATSLILEILTSDVSLYIYFKF